MSKNPIKVKNYINPTENESKRYIDEVHGKNNGKKLKNFVFSNFRTEKERIVVFLYS